jgi:hypothetical protein
MSRWHSAAELYPSIRKKEELGNSIILHFGYKKKQSQRIN